MIGAANVEMTAARREKAGWGVSDPVSLGHGMSLGEGHSPSMMLAGSPSRGAISILAPYRCRHLLTLGGTSLVEF